MTLFITSRMRRLAMLKAGSVADACLRCAACIVFLCVSIGSVAAEQPAGAFVHGDWPFLPPVRPPVPAVADRDWPVNPIDAFVLHELEAAGLSPNQEEEKSALLRRVSFDLTGLPPTPEEQDAFFKDASADVYLNVVDRLLASPAYGERWAQHWLDLVRYAETEGFKADLLRPMAYKYRDYVIRSFNADRPYDEFVRQQLAGDELYPGDPDGVIATGLNRLYPDENNAANLFQRRQEILDDVTETTGLAFMGLTMGCARCHDHKFDDILQTDFYKLEAFFAPMVERDDLPAATAEEVETNRRQLAEWKEATAAIREEIDNLLAAKREKAYEEGLTKFRAEIQECYHKPPAERTPLEEQIARMAQKQVDVKFSESAAVKGLPKEQQARYGELKKQLKEFEHLRPKPLPVAMAVSDVGEAAPATYLLEGGDWRKPDEVVPPGIPEFLGGSTAVSIPARAENSTGRRSALARWLTRPDHPLTARVIVNRLWHHHFGRGIVASPNDFGNMGEPPTHPDLLDWLAVELTERGWSLKHIHRLIVTSATYRQSARVEPSRPNHAKAMAADPANDLLWHARRRRLEGEAIRDAMLEVAGLLDFKRHGKSALPPLPKGVSARYAWKPDTKESEPQRRSIYVLAKRNMQLPIFEAFDKPGSHSSCAMRIPTTSAPQALLMLNSAFTQQLAGRWAERLIDAYGRDAKALVSRAYVEAFGRRAEADEIEAALAFLADHEPTVRDDTSAAASDDTWTAVVADFCHAMFNANEFIYLD